MNGKRLTDESFLARYEIMANENKQLREQIADLVAALKAIKSGRVKMKQWVDTYAEDNSPLVNYIFSDASLRSLVAQEALAQVKGE